MVLGSSVPGPPPLVLASASPRRRELLARLGVPFDVRPVDVEEDIGRARDPQVAARKIARVKAEAARLQFETPALLTADTIVWFDGRSLAKPGSPGEARQMLTALRGRTHEVVSAVALMPENKRSALVRHPVTRVTLRDLTDDEIEASVERGDPFDKAGAYAIQDPLVAPVASYNGCYCNVIGLSLWATIELLRKSAHPATPRTDNLLPQCATCPLALR